MSRVITRQLYMRMQSKLSNFQEKYVDIFLACTRIATEITVKGRNKQWYVLAVCVCGGGGTYY